MRYPDPQTLSRSAQELRREELRRIGCAAAIKWASLMHSLRVRLPLVLSGPERAPARHAPHPCQSPSPTHA
jgi:hypothetical protein